MQKLSFQDAAFLRGETAARPQHVGALMVFSRPKNASSSYLRELAAALPDRLAVAAPMFLRKLKDPGDLISPGWTDAEDFDQDYHFRHYALPQPGRMDDLMRAVSLAHEPQLDRHRPLFEYHLIEGLPRNRFALYSRVHHAMIDGASGMSVMDRFLDPAPQSVKRFVQATRAEVARRPSKQGKKSGWLDLLGKNVDMLRDQVGAVPEVINQIRGMGMNREADGDLAPLPFTSPPSVLNREGGPGRRLMILDLPLKSLREIGHHYGGTVNDVLIALLGGALRSYLLEQDALPKSSLVAALPVSVRSTDREQGNALSLIMSPLGTNIGDPAKRLKRIIRVTSKAKSGMSEMSRTSLQDLLNMVMLPMIVLNLTGTAGKIRPGVNLILSNVPGPRRTLYLADAPLQGIYPISLLMDAMALNFTAISYRRKVCIGLIACPDGLDGIESLENRIRQAHDELRGLLD